MDSRILFLFALIPVLASASGAYQRKHKGYGKKDDCPHGFIRLRGQRNCYRFSSDRTTWYIARLKCQEMGGYLAIIKDQRESDAITKYLIKTLDKKNAQRGDHDFWIGLQDQVLEGYFDWDTQPLKFVSTPANRNLTFHNWEDDEPNAAGPGTSPPAAADCVRLNNADTQTDDVWKWADWDCNFETFFYLCEATPRRPFRCNTH